MTGKRIPDRVNGTGKRHSVREWCNVVLGSREVEEGGVEKIISGPVHRKNNNNK